MNSHALVLTCEHGGNRIPAAYQAIFADQQALLASHRGFDAGALSVAESLSVALSAPLLASRVSRLLVDLNRSIGHPNLHHPAIRKLGADARRRILNRYYLPYRARAEHTVRQTIAAHGSTVHVASHSFTAELAGTVRSADIGLLYDPARPREVALCECWKATLKACAPGLCVRRNYPYAGKGDGLTASLRRLFPDSAYVGVELEINQKHVVAGGRRWLSLRRVIVASLDGALNGLGQPGSNALSSPANLPHGAGWHQRPPGAPP